MSKWGKLKDSIGFKLGNSRRCNENNKKAIRYDALLAGYEKDKRPDWLIVESWRRSHERMKQLDAGEPFMVLLNELRDAKAQHRCDCYTLDTHRMHRKEDEDKLNAIRELLRNAPIPPEEVPDAIAEILKTLGEE